MKRYIITFVLAVATLLPALAQFPIEMMRRQLQNRTSFDMKTDAWNAMWIEVPGTQPKDYGVYYFRKDVDLNVKPSKFVVYVSGDTRYKLDRKSVV